MSNQNFTYSFQSSKPAEEIFKTLQDIWQWWFGIYDETITGTSEQVNDVFRFVAGGGAHDTTQKLVELIPGKKVVWLVTESNLSFLKKPGEWKDTQFSFELSKAENGTKVTFTHIGLQPAIECYNSCSGGWMLYLKKLELALK